MRKAIPLALAACFLCAAGLFAQAVAVGKTGYIQVRDAQLRAKPSYTGKIVVKLEYGKSSVLVLEVKGDWSRVQVTGTKTEGWILASALNPKKVAMSSGSATKTGTTAAEEGAAAKGFNKEIEAEYRKSGEHDYTWVEAMERMKVSPEAAMAFRAQGGLPAEDAE